MEIKRDLTNLAIRKELMLPKAQLKKGFLFVFNKGFTGSELVFLHRLWVSALIPGIATDPRFGKLKNLKLLMKDNNPQNYARLLRVSKELATEVPHFRVSIPMFSQVTLTKDSIATELKKWFFEATSSPAPATSGSPDGMGPQGVTPPQDAVPQTPSSMSQNPAHFDLPEDVSSIVSRQDQTVQKAFISREVTLRNATWMNPSIAEELGESFLGVRVETLGSRTVVFLDFSVSKAVAQQLTSTPWIGIRNIDLYPLIFNWILVGYGSKGRPLLSSFPISSIAKTLPTAHSQPENLRIDVNGISIDPTGDPLALPKEVNNTQRYEDLYAEAGTRDDNSYSYDFLGNESPAHLPANIPVLIDWQNLKFAYSNTSGVLQVMDLTRNIPCTAAHAAELMSHVLSDSLITRFLSLAMAAGTPVSTSAYFKESDLEDANSHADTESAIPAADLITHSDIGNYFKSARGAYQRHAGQDAVQLYEITADGWPLFRPLYRFLVQLNKDVVDNTDAVYHKYSVSFTIAVMGWVALIARYGANYANTKAEAATLTKAATDQKVDPDWTMPSVPMLSDKIGLLPHQAKVRNLLKDSPAFAILPIQAGGGKTPIALIDILLEIKANTNQPYLLLCPSHLVAQYVKEIVYFTSGKLNVIPITSYATRVNGYARLTEIFKAAPRNTVVVCDYDALRFRAVNLVYGTTPTAIYPVIEFLRQFRFGYVMLDESHYVKNNSSRSRATLALIADIPKKRLASGTMAHDSPSDLAMQVAMLDPTLFGSKDQFNGEYGLKVKGDRVIEWKPNAAQAIMAKIKTRVVVAGAMRKEWAALLPQPQEKFLRVDLTPAQHAVYMSILEKTLEEIKEAAKSNSLLAKFVSGEANPESTESEDEDDSEALENMLRPYLARLEQFITAPAKDPLGDKLLSGEDRVSPKVRMIANRIRQHIESGAEGKCLVFTNYTASAEDIFENMPPDLQSMGILYRAADKVEAGALFENSVKKKWMVGVENSMNTGLNLQFVSRLIRCETVWNPGTLEQGNSRINRPELKKADRRDFIFYDWIVANSTIDVTKISRLISKIVAIAKFENADDGNYQGLPDVPVIKMDLDSITTFNSWDSSLLDYFNAYKDFKQVQATDYEDYRTKHGNLSLAPIEAAPTPSDAMLLKRVPYVPGLELYGAADLGLVRLDEYLRLDASDSEDDSDEGDDDQSGDSTPNGDDVARLKGQLVGKMVHTEYGDGEITGLALSSRRVAVRLTTGYIVRTRLANTFLVTRTETSTRDIRNQLLKGVGSMPIATPVDVPATIFKQATFTKKELRIQERKELEKQKLIKKVKKAPVKALATELQFSVSNGFLGLTYVGDDEEVSRALEAVGFRHTAPFLFAEVKTAPALVKQFNVWKEAGFTLDKKIAEDLSQAFRNLHKVMAAGAVKTHRLSYRFSMASKLKNFFRLEVKPNTDPKVIKPYPLIEDGKAFIILPVRGQTGTQKAITHKAAGVRWHKSPQSMIYFCPTAQKAEDVMKMVIHAGLEVSNIRDLEKEFRKIKKVQFRSDDDLDNMEV